MLKVIISILLTLLISIQSCKFPDDVTKRERIDFIWNSIPDEFRMELPEYQAYEVGLSYDDYIYMAQVVEAESDRTDSLDGKILIAAVIFNRVTNPNFASSVRSVLDEPGQFSTTSNGSCYISSTKTSRWAIYLAYNQLEGGDIPDNLLFFNSIGYNNGSAYGYVDGNYFMTA